jgi:3-oxoacyl-[acyl-carrier-protein] synthase III
MIDGIPRRSRLDLHTPAELAIRAAVEAVEAAGAHKLLTDAVVLLHEARERVADFVEAGL